MSDAPDSDQASEAEVEFPQDVEAALFALRRGDSRYSVHAYRFAFEALEYTMREYLKLSEARHINGRELAEGMRRFALRQFGFLAFDVWQHWGIRSTLDLGYIIFNLVQAGLLRKTDDDRIDDFADVFHPEEGLKSAFRMDLDAL